MTDAKAKLKVEGSTRAGYWINLGPGVLRLGAVYPTPQAAEQRLEFYRRLYRVGAPARSINATG